MHDNVWQLQEAKSHFSEVVERAIDHQPQVVTKRGRQVVVICSIEDYKDKDISGKDLFNFFRKKPYFDNDMILDRSKDLPRKVKIT